MRCGLNVLVENSFTKYILFSAVDVSEKLICQVTNGSRTSCFY
jgi:hypothetical protein